MKSKTFIRESFGIFLKGAQKSVMPGLLVVAQQIQTIPMKGGMGNIHVKKKLRKHLPFLFALCSLFTYHMKSLNIY